MGEALTCGTLCFRKRAMEMLEYPGTSDPKRHSCVAEDGPH